MLDPHAIKSAIRKVKDLQYTDIEIKVRDATNNDPWGTKTALLQEIADATHNYEEYPRLFSMLWRRLTDINHVMHVQKALILIEYLLRNGADRFIRDAKQRSRDIQKLKKYKHYDQNSEDDAKDARIKAKRVFDLLTNDKLLQEARQQADKIKGMKLTGTGIEGGDRYGGAYGGGGYAGGGGHEKEPDRYSTFTPQELAERNGTEGEQQQQKPRKPTKKKDEDEDEEENEQQDDPFGPPQELGGDSKKTKSSTKDKSGQETVAPKKTTKKKKEKKKKPEEPKDQEKDKPKNIPKPTVDGDDPFSAQFEEEDDDNGGFQPRKGESNQPSSTTQSKSKGGGGGFDKFAAAFDEGSSQNLDFLSSDHNTTNKQIDFDKLRVTDKQKDVWDIDSDKNKQTPTTTKSNTPDDPWNSLTSLDNLSNKPVPKKEAPTTGKSMASMRSSQPQTLDLGGTNPFADSPFATGPQQQQSGGRGGQPGGYYQQPYQGGFPQGPYGGGPYGGVPYGGGGFVPNPGYGIGPTPYGGGGGFGGPSQTHDPFASLSGPQMQGGGNKNKPTQAFENLSW